MKRKKGFRIVRIIIIFLVIVVAGTVMSRFASSTLTPKVEIMYASSGSISRDVVQDVMIEGDSRAPVYSYPDLMVQAIYVHKERRQAYEDRDRRAFIHISDEKT